MGRSRLHYLSCYLYNFLEFAARVVSCRKIAALFLRMPFCREGNEFGLFGVKFHLIVFRY